MLCDEIETELQSKIDLFFVLFQFLNNNLWQGDYILYIDVMITYTATCFFFFLLYFVSILR